MSKSLISHGAHDLRATNETSAGFKALFCFVKVDDCLYIKT